MGLLTNEHLALIGSAEPSVEIEISRRDIQKYAAATEQQQAKYLVGDEAPPMFIFNLFTEVSPLSNLRSDGLVRGDGSGPKLPLKRIMAGGTEIRQHQAIKPGDRLTGTRRIVDMYEKQGSSGPLIFTVRELAVINEEGETVLEEIQSSIAR
ncbi:MAG: FAS1-like dehydratase domain-containing protein [Pseudomonadales bacterium]